MVSSEVQTFNYRNGGQYFEALKLAVANGTRVVKPKNLTDLVRTMEQEDNFEAVFAASFSIMYERNRSATALARIARLKHGQQQAHEYKTNGSVKSKSVGSAANQAIVAPRTSKITTIPTSILESTCVAIKMAALMYVHNTESIRMLMLSVYNDKSDATKTVVSTLELSSRPTNEVRDFITRVNNTSTPLEERCGLLRALITLANAFKLPSCARLASEISDVGYTSLIKVFLDMNDANPMTNQATYEPIITKFIKDSIPRIRQAEERVSINKQMQVNVSATISKLLKTNDVTVKSDTNLPDINPNIEYEYYRGPINYTRDIITTYGMHEGRRYRILTYNDCLYDVIGYSIENTDSKGQRINDCEIFDHMRWSDRLRILDFYTTVSLRSAKGSELIEMLSVEQNIDSDNTIDNDNEKKNNTDQTPTFTGGDVTVNWMDEKNLSRSKTLTIKKSKKKLPTKTQSKTMMMMMPPTKVQYSEM